MFRNATMMGVPADGRFVNAVFRCFGDDIDAALSAWKNEIRKFCISYEQRPRRNLLPKRRAKGKNLVAAYNGLLNVCGRALRGDIALRIIYAMNKEGLEPNELSLNCYRSGKRVRESAANRLTFGLAQKLNIADPYESLLYVECIKFDSNDKRTAGDRRVRIIM
jgi:pentatricopeptide repeat protein